MDNVLVIGGGIAGIQASIDIANMGFKVYLVEKSPSIGGRMAQLDKTFPTNDCSICILAPKMIECSQHKNITLLTYSEITKVIGSVGNFNITILNKQRYVDNSKCNGCNKCSEVCPVELPNEFDMELGNRKAIYKYFPQAIPNVYVIDKKGISPCRGACPAGINVQGYVALIAKGKFNEALAIIKETIPFPSTIGRICTRPCESICNRKEIDEPINICGLKRFVADYYDLPSPTIEKSKEKIAIIGSGPAGLTAGERLAKQGYRVTIFESLPVAGGMLGAVIPEYRLPKQVIQKEIDSITGIEIKLNTTIGKDITISELFNAGFKALFIATGAHKDLKLNIKGETLPNVMPAVAFLKHIKLQGKIKLKGIVVVIGGGNSAIDAARSAIRLGAKEVRIYYRRTKAEMPALKWEIGAAEKEGIKIYYLIAPIEITRDSIKSIRMELGEPDTSGRRRPIPIKGSEFSERVDFIIPAIGQSTDLSFIPNTLGLKISPQNTIIADAETGMTNIPGIFAGGDVVTGPSTAIEAVACGKKVALSIHKYLNNEPLTLDIQLPKVISYQELDIKGIQNENSYPCISIAPSKRIKNFKEVELGYDTDTAMKEANRCLQCAGCCDCRECEKVCEPKAINHDMKEQYIELNVRAIVLATGFEPADISSIKEYGYGTIKNVITALEYERMISASGPTNGKIKMPSDGKRPKRIAFIQCVGSRDESHKPYCSAVCCMHATKEAILSNEHYPDIETFIFYTDLRATGKRFQEYIERAKKEYKVKYIRSKPGKITELKDNPIIWYEDTITQKVNQMEVDMVVIAQALIPSESNKKIAELMGIKLDEYGFIDSPDKLYLPVDTSIQGIFACGYCQSPQDIPDSVIQASAVAAKVAEISK
ncbi:MAG: FAD-dependent oxidoreductase [Candidatus Stahlbacteria bacterium]|nr:FAD-dependent oxidoreductase [Candidatus Stahlbacteria bacterium]